MRILILQDDFPPHVQGGAGVVASVLAREYARRGHEVVVLCAVTDRALAGEETDNGMRVVRVYSNHGARWRAWTSLYNPSVARILRKLLKEHMPEMVHVHNIHTQLSYWSVALAVKSGARVVMTAHDTMLFDYGKTTHAGRVSIWSLLCRYRFRYNPLRQAAIRYALGGVHLVAVSRALAGALAANGFAPTAVIHNGIDPSAWEQEPYLAEDFKQRHGLAGAKLVLFGGRISGEKGAPQALAALERVRTAEPAARLLVLGRRELSGAANVGWLSGEELKAAYHASDVVLVPSVYLDPFPTINLEAMACRKPVVATSFGGSPEAVKDGETGYVVDPRDTALLAERLLSLLEDTNLRERMGAAGWRRAVDEFSLARQAEEYLRLARP